MEQGREIGELARQLFPNGRFPPRTPDRKLTINDIAHTDHTTLFEVDFQWNRFVARADILQRENAGWHVIEVKSSFADTDSLDALLDDLSYTVMVAMNTGWSVARASLMMLSRQYQFGAPPAKLFEIVDHTKVVLARARTFTEEVPSRLSELAGAEKPTPLLKPACRSCPFFEAACLGKGVQYSVLELPHLHKSKLDALASRSVVALESLPAEIELTETQERVRTVALSGKPFISDRLGNSLDAIEWPCYYLDFESVATALPLYRSYGCHQQMLTQFSVHWRHQPGDRLQHAEFLADADRDCQRDLVNALLRALGNQGAIVVYSHFEKQRLKDLAKKFPDLADGLVALQDRLCDLLPVIKQHVYHPAFKGSYSIKSVLPALVPDLSYSDLEIAGGDTAITRFARMARGQVPAENIPHTRRALLKYCARDTLAMVRLHDALLAFASADEK